MAVPGALLVAAGAVLIFSVALSPEAHDRVTFNDFHRSCSMFTMSTGCFQWGSLCFEPPYHIFLTYPIF